jgi:hypothetical protein
MAQLLHHVDVAAILGGGKRKQKTRGQCCRAGGSVSMGCADGLSVCSLPSNYPLGCVPAAKLKLLGPNWA